MSLTEEPGSVGRDSMDTFIPFQAITGIQLVGMPQNRKVVLIYKTRDGRRDQLLVAPTAETMVDVEKVSEAVTQFMQLYGASEKKPMLALTQLSNYLPLRARSRLYRSQILQVLVRKYSCDKKASKAVVSYLADLAFSLVLHISPPLFPFSIFVFSMFSVSIFPRAGTSMRVLSWRRSYRFCLNSRLPFISASAGDCRW